MKFDVRAVAVAAGSIAALAYGLCAAFFALVPEATAVYVTAGVLHIDSTGLNRPTTVGTVVVGLVVWGLGTAIAAGATAWLYNRLARAEGGVRSAASQRAFVAAGRTA